ncbi:MAG: diguanylate cyclase, partial [Herminiimonas sp.]|nr:diguanylate cyclase [Herminiimonas sp.]
MDHDPMQLQDVLNTAAMAVWQWQIISPGLVAGDIAWSAEAAALLGLPAAPVRQDMPAFLAQIHVDDRQRVTQAMQVAGAAGERLDLEYRLVRQDGSLCWLAARAATLPVAAPSQTAPAPTPSALRLIGLLWDVSHKKVLELEALAHGEMAAMTLGSIGDAVLTTDAQGRVQTMNRVAEQLTGWSSSDAVGAQIDTVLRIVDEATDKPAENPVLKSLRLDQTVVFTNHSALISRNGHRIAIEDTAAPIRGSDGVTRGVVMVFHDVSHERQLRHELSWQASHDALTGLINRREFEFQVAAALASAKSERDTHALLYLDLDQFKIVNDTCGHCAGDVLLQNLAGLLQSHMRDSDVLARLGGDELGVLLLNCPPRQA